MDIETFNDNNTLKLYSIGFYDGNLLKTYYLTDYKDDKEMVKNCFNDLLVNKQNNSTVYFHNFSKFDSLFLIKYLQEFSLNKIIMKENSIISLNLKKKTISLKIKDSYLMLNQSLNKLCKSFNVENQKLEFDYNKINKNNLDL